MAQLRKLKLAGQDDGMVLPPHLVPELGPDSQLTAEEKKDVAAFQTWSANVDTKVACDAGFLLFIEQRRKTRTWVIVSSVVAATLSLGAGYLAWGRKGR